MESVVSRVGITICIQMKPSVIVVSLNDLIGNTLVWRGSSRNFLTASHLSAYPAAEHGKLLTNWMGQDSSVTVEPMTLHHK